MTNDQGVPGHFEPIHDAHAIEQVLFGLQFERPLDDPNLAQASKVAEQFSSDLPGRADIQGLTFAFGAGGQPLATGPRAGSVFHRTAPDGTVENELRVEVSSLTFRTSIYTRWKDVWERARKYLDAIVPIYVAQTRLSGVSLNFVDKFAWTGSITECRLNSLLRPDSKYLCPYVYSAEDLWHSHTGAFLRAGATTKRLLNINVDLLDENRPTGLRRVLAIRTVLTDLLNQPGYQPLELTTGDVAEFVNGHMHDLHDFGKVAFGNIISEDMSKRIALL